MHNLPIDKNCTCVLCYMYMRVCMFKTTQLRLKFVRFPIGVKEGPGGGLRLGI